MDTKLLSRKLDEYVELESKNKQKFETEAQERENAIKYYQGFSAKKS